jgi:uroporphyrinogen-III synthase
MRVLVTRPLGDAEETATKLIALGHEAIVAPLLDITFRDGPALVLDGVQAILATSANGVRGLARRTPRRDIALLAVGAHSAATAHDFGFRDVRHANGDAAALVDLVVARCVPEKGELLHVSGSETRGDIGSRLAERGFRVRKEILYDAIAAISLPRPAAEALSGGALDAALFFSPRTARVFSDLVTRSGLAPACAKILGLAISEAAAAELRPLPFRDVRTAARPGEDALLALLE